MISTKQTIGSPRRPARSVLLIVAFLFLMSGLLRLGGDAGQAIAREIAGMTEAPAPQEPLQCAPEPDLAALLHDLEARERRVETAEQQLADRLQVLQVAEASFEQNLQDLIAAEDALARTMARSETAAEEDIARLTAVYENMKAAEAAALFETMAPEFSAGFLGRMRPDAAAAIMAGLDPQTAYTISVVLAGRNAGAPTN